MPQPECEPMERASLPGGPVGAGPGGGTVTERLLAHSRGLDRLFSPMGDRYARQSGGGGFSKYPGWDEQPHPWSQRSGGGTGERRAEAAAPAAGATAATVTTAATAATGLAGSAEQAESAEPTAVGARR